MSGPLTDVERLRKEALANSAEATRIERLAEKYPNLRRFEGRWKKVVYCSKDVNTKVTGFDMRHNCGCCSDSPLEVWPYLETPYGPVYSDPPQFFVGERGFYGGDIPDAGWEAKLRNDGIAEPIIESVAAHFAKCAEEAKAAVAEEYGDA